jgi:tetratricopeptide (TPR) repeat protein
MKILVRFRSVAAGGAFALAAGLILAGATSAAASPLARQQAVGQKQGAPAADDRSQDSLLAKAQGDIDNEDYAAAAGKYEEYLAQHPQDAQIHFQLGYCDTALQKMSDARAEYQKATELDPRMAPAFLNLGLTELAGDPAAAVAPLSRAVELMPDQERPKLLLATALAHSGKTDDAIVQYQAAEKLDAVDYQVHMGLGAALLTKGLVLDAEKEFRAAVALDGKDAHAHLGLGECLIAEKKYEEGGDELAVYLKSQPGDEKVRLARVSALIDSAKYDDALDELNHAGSADQQTLPALELRYDALNGAKRYDDAAATLNRAEALAPQDAAVREKMAQLDLNRKDYVRAAEEFIAVLKLQPKDIDALAGLVSAEYLIKDYGDTLKAINLLSQQKALPVPTLFVRADCYDKLGHKAEALDAYDKFLAANTDHNSDMYFAASERARDLRREGGKKQK